MLANHLGERATPTLVAYCDNETVNHFTRIYFSLFLLS